MSHSYQYQPSGLNFADFHSQEDADKFANELESQGYQVSVWRFGSCHYEVQYYKEVN